MTPQTICQQFWKNVIAKIQIERDPISKENYRDYETLTTQNLVIDDRRYGAVYAVDNLYCAYKSVIQLLNKKDPKIHDFKTGLYNMHDKEGLITLKDFENFKDFYGIKEALPIYSKEEFDKGFNNHKMFMRDCIIMIHGSSVDQSYMHMLAYKAAGKKYAKLMEMEYQDVEDDKIDTQTVPNKVEVEAKQPKYIRKAKTPLFSGTRKDFFHMLRLACNLYSERFQNGLLTESFEPSSVYILGQLALHKSYVYQHIDFSQDFSQIVYSTICVMLNRKSDLVLMMPPKTINLPTRYVSNVTKGEKSKNSKTFPNDLKVGVWKTKKQKQLVKQKRQEQQLQDNKDKKQQKLLMKQQVDQAAELCMLKDIAKSNMKMIHDKIVDDYMNKDQSQVIDLCLSYDCIQQDQNADLSFNIYTNNSSSLSEELQCFGEPMTPFDIRTHELLTEQQATLRQQANSQDIMLLASQLPLDQVIIAEMDQAYVSAQQQDKYSKRWEKFTKNIVISSSSQFEEEQLLPISDDEDVSQQQDNVSQQDLKIDTYEDSNIKTALMGALNVCESNKSIILKSNSLINLWFLTVLIAKFVACYDAFFVLIEIVMQFLMHVILSSIQITYEYGKLLYYIYKSYFIDSWIQFKRILRDSTLKMPVVAISQPALLGVQPASLAQIYSHYVTPVQLLNKDKIHHWQYVDGYGMVANPQPGVTKQCTQAIQKAGLYVHAKSINNNTTTGGGHSCIRYCSDSMFSKSLQYIAQTHEPMVVIDVGAKYGSMLSILNQIYIKKNIKPGHFCGYLPVRPNDIDYDQAYHEQNFGRYNRFIFDKETKQKDGKNTIFNLPVQQKYIQDVDWDLVQFQIQECFGFIDGVKYYVIMNDCHYYFDNTFSLPFKHTLLLSGMNYTGYTGTYLLPFSDGYFQIDANQETKRGQITMMPQSTTKKYTHPYTFIDKTDCEIDFGWISFIQKVQVMQPDQKYDICTPNVIDVGCNVQQHYFYQYYSSLPSNYDTIKQQQARWEKQQFKDTVEVQYNSQEALLYQCKNRSIFKRIILYIYHSWIMRFIFGEIQHVYEQSAYIHLPKAGLTKTPTRAKPNAVLHDQVEYSERSKKTMIGAYKTDQMIGTYKADQIKLGYISPQTFKDINYALGLQPQDLDYNTLEHVIRPKETKYTKISANKQQNYTTCYVTKDFPDTVILNASQINPLIKVSGQDGQYNYNYQQCIKQYHNAEIIKQTTLVLPTGIRHLRMTQEEQLATVEFATTSIHNQIFALYGRCFKSQQQFSQMHLQSYEKMVQRFLTWFEIQLNKLSAERFDPIQWIDQKDDFPFDKKQKYQRTILQQLKGNVKDFQFSYKSMLKSGEEFLISMEDLDLPKVVVDKKPRDIKVPAPQGCGIFTAIQSEFWEPIKQILPGFIQGYLPQDLKDLFKHNIDKYDSVISDDGSSFEATQFYDLQQIVDKPVMLILLKWFKQMNMNNAIFQDLWINMPLDKLVDVLCPDKNLVFVKMPNDGEVWDDVTIRWWNRDWKQAHGPAEDNYEKYLPYWIRGTTFSGVPQTTLMNTFRKLTYSYYDIYVATGIDAWVSDEFFVAAAGDDGITMGNNLDNQLTKIQQVKLDLSNPDTKIRGLGQCITEAPITESWNFDFCSKLILRDHGVFMGRDLLKILTQKQYYTKKNQVFQVYPHLHVQAILDGLIPERSSRLLEDIIRVRLEKVTIDEHTDYKLPEKKHYHSLTTDTGYEFEDIINQYLNIDLSDLIMHIESGQAIDPRPLKTHSVDKHQDMKLGYFEPYKTTKTTTIKTKNNLNFNSKMNQQQKKKPMKLILSNRRKKQQTRDRAKQNVNKRPNTVNQVNMKQSQNQKRTQFHVVKSKNNFQQLQVKHRPTMDYIKSVLNPFNADAVRAPSDFHLPTSILNHRFEIDHIFGTTHGVACLLPQHMSGQAATNTPSWFNIQGVHSTQTTAATLGGAGILTGECPLAGYHSTDPSSGGQTAENKRFTSARLLRVGIKIYPTANLTVKSGTVVIAQVPGKTFYSNTSSIKIPTVQQLKQYPTSITVNLSTIDQSGQSYVWLPLDVDDTIFQSPSLGRDGLDNQASMQQYRNPIWACFEGISAQDSYRFEVYSSYEYVPTMLFESWANVSVTKTPSGAYNVLKKILDDDLFKAVAGIVGEELTQSKYATGVLKPAFDTFMSFV